MASFYVWNFADDLGVKESVYYGETYEKLAETVSGEEM